MATREVKTKIEITGEAECKKQLSGIATSLKLYNSELEQLKQKHKDSQNGIEYLTKNSEALNRVYEKQNDKVNTLKDALQKAQNAQSNYTKKVEEAKKKHDDAALKVDKLKNSVGENSKEYKKAKEKLEEYHHELKTAERQEELCKQAVQNWQAQLNSAEVQLEKTNDKIEKNNRYLDEAKESASGCASSIDRFGKVQKQAAEDTDKNSNALKRSVDAFTFLTNAVISQGAKESFNKVREAIEECVKAAEKYESAIAKLQTISGESSIGVLSEDILSLSSATGIAASDLANTAYNAISAGTAVSEAVGMAENASKLAIAGFTDTDSALSVLTTAINAYGDSAGTATEISDSLIQVQNLGVTTVAELAANMGKAIATASAYSVNLSNLESAYISTTKSGINTAESTTYISSMLKELGDSGTEVAKIVQEKTGKSFGQLMQSGESLGDVLKILLDNCNGDAEALMNLWSSAEAGKASNAILNQGIDTFNKNLQTVQTSAGATESAYKTMADTTEMAGKRAANAFENLKIAVGEQLNPAIAKVQNDFADMTEGFTEFVKENPQVVSAIEAVAVGLGVMVAGVIAVNVAVNVLIPLIKSLTLTMKENPLGLMVTAATALIAALVTLAANAEEAEGAMKDFHDATSIAEEASDDLKKSMEEADEAFSDTAGEIEGTATQATSLMQRLEELSKKSNKSNEDIAEMSSLVDQLNELYPELGLEINKTTGELNKTNTELERFIKNAQNAAMTEAFADKMKEESEAVVDAQKNLATAQDKNIKAKEEYANIIKQQTELQEKERSAIDAQNDAYTKYSDILNKAGVSVEEIDEAERKYEEAKNNAAAATDELINFNDKYSDTLIECESAQKEAQDAIEDGNKTLEDAQDTLNNTTSAYEDYKFKLTDVGDACQDTFDKTIEMLDAMDQSNEAYENLKGQLQAVTNEHLYLQEQTQATYDSLKTELDDVMAKFDEETASIQSNLESQIGGIDAAKLEIQYSAQEIADNLQSQINYISEYMKNVQAITSSDMLTMNDEFKAFLTSGSEEAVQTAAAMNQAITEGNYGAAQAVIDNYAGVKDALSNTSSALADASGNYSTQINDLKSQMMDCVNEMDQRDKAYTNVLQTFQRGIDAANGKATPYKSVFSKTATSAVEKLDKSNLASTYAANNIFGAIQGAQSLAGSYVAVYRNMANAAIAEMKRVDQQQSPSRRYKRHGRYNVEGAILGVKEMTGAYVKAYGDMATQAIDEYNSQIEGLAPIAVKATETLFGSSGSVDINAGIDNGVGSMIDGLGNAVTSVNRSTATKLDKVVGLLEKYLPTAGTTYLDGEKVNKRISEIQAASAKRRAAVQGVK